MEDFLKLNQIPIQIIWGDNLTGNWPNRKEVAQVWADLVNSHGGDVEILDLPAIGITGNTHFRCPI
jgi:hypothetical protein